MQISINHHKPGQPIPPIHGGFGLINSQRLKKPSYQGYWFLSRLGNELLAEGDSFVVTRCSNGTLAILLWNYCHYRPDAQHSRLIDKVKQAEVFEMFEIQPDRYFSLTIIDLGQNVRIQSTRFDRDHGSVYDPWVTMGAPEHIRPAELVALRQRMELGVAVVRVTTQAGVLQLAKTVKPFGVTLLEINTELKGVIMK